MTENLFLPTELSPDAFKSLLPDFFEEINDDYADLKSANSAKEFKQVMLIGHKLKGSSASYGAKLISDCSLSIQMAVEKKSFDELDELIEKLGVAIEKTKGFADKEF